MLHSVKLSTFFSLSVLRTFFLYLSISLPVLLSLFFSLLSFPIPSPPSPLSDSRERESVSAQREGGRERKRECFGSERGGERERESVSAQREGGRERKRECFGGSDWPVSSEVIGDHL